MLKHGIIYANIGLKSIIRQDYTIIDVSGVQCRFVDKKVKCN